MNRAAVRYMYLVAATFWCVNVGLAALNVNVLLAKWPVWLPLLGLAMIAEAFEVATADGSAGGVMSFSAAAHVAAVILLGPVVAACVAAAAVVLVDGMRGQRPVVVAVNSAMFGWASLAAGGVYLLAGGHTGEVSSAWGVALVGVVVSRYAVNALVFAVGDAVASGLPIVRVAMEKLVDGASAGLGEGSLGVLLAAGWGASRWITLPFLVPLFVALYSSKSNLERLKQETDAALTAFAHMIDRRDPNTARHTERVAGYVQQFVGAIGLPHREAERLVQAARYHDLGKIAIDEATLSKSGRLTEGELRAIRRHPRLSAKLLQPFGFAREIARYAELHHERYDGRGYYAVPGHETATEAHVLIVADSFDAMTSIRAYRPALTADEAVQELLDKAGTQFHPLVARAFVAVLQGRDVRDTLTAAELAQLVGSFERISALPRLQRSTLREARVGLVSLVGAAMIGLAVTPSGLPRLGVIASAAIGIAVLGARTLHQRRRERRALRRIRHGASIEAALAAGGIAAQTRWMWWDANADTYQIDGSDDLDEEIASRASLAANADAIRLSDSRYLVVKTRTPEHALAVLLPNRPTRHETWLVEKIAAEADAPTEPTKPEDARRSSDTTSRTLVLVAKLHAFERIRAGAGQLTAARVVRDAKLAVESCLRGTDSVSVCADDELVISLGDVPDKEIHRLCQRLAAELTRVQVPKRVDPISATFDVTWRSDPTQDGDTPSLRLVG